MTEVRNSRKFIEATGAIVLLTLSCLFFGGGFISCGGVGIVTGVITILTPTPFLYAYWIGFFK